MWQALAIATLTMALMVPAEAQMRGGMRGFAGVGRAAPVGNFRGGGRGALPFHPRPVPGLRGPAFPGFTPFHDRFSGFVGFNGFGNGFRNRFRNRFRNPGFFCDGFGVCFGGRLIPRHRRFGASFGFGLGAFPFYGGWGYGYPYGASYDGGYQNDYYVQYQMAQNERLMNDMEEDHRRNLELSEEVAELRAADAADAARARTAAAPAQSRAPERPAPPTVLIFRDHHQQEVTDYAIYNDTLVAFGPNQRSRIPLASLDLPATVQANEQRGVDFRVPQAPRR